MNRFHFLYTPKHSSLSWYLFLSLAFLLSISCIGHKFYNKTPDRNGPGKIISVDNIYYSLFPSDFEDILSCGTRKFNSYNRFTPDRELVFREEETFRNSFYEFLVGPAENLHSDSTGSIGYYPGEYYISKPVSRKKMIRHQKKEYKKAINWNRQYIGFINSNGDSLLYINMLDPREWGNEGLGYGWFFGADGALNYVYDIVYNLRDNSISYNLCESIE